MLLVWGLGRADNLCMVSINNLVLQAAIGNAEDCDPLLEFSCPLLFLYC